MSTERFGVIDDPQALRAAAASLRQEAARIAQLSSRVSQRVAASSYAGPRADEFRVVTAQSRGQIESACHELEDVAAWLESTAHAADVEITTRRAAAEQPW